MLIEPVVANAEWWTQASRVRTRVVRHGGAWFVAGLRGVPILNLVVETRL